MRKRLVRRRLRRTPERARQELLDGAERVFARFSPGDVGLKDIAREVGVSHALVTHYFGTYAGLVEATLERRVRALRARVLDKLHETGAVERPRELLDLMFDALSDPVHLRLVKWLLASDRSPTVPAFALQDGGMRTIAVEVAHALVPPPGRASAELVDTVERAVLVGVSAAYGYSLNKHVLASALGRPAGVAELDEAVRKTLAAMLQGYVEAEIAKGLSTVR